ncbi:Protein of unknown function, partial [Pyronema omphalodes CBS 100304]
MQFRKGIQLAALLAAVSSMATAAPASSGSSIIARGENYDSTPVYGQDNYDQKKVNYVVVDYDTKKDPNYKSADYIKDPLYKATNGAINYNNVKDTKYGGEYRDGKYFK